MTLDKLVVQIRNLSGESSKWQHLAEVLKEESKGFDRQKQQLPGVLNTLDPAQHSLGYLHLLEAAGSSADGRQEYLDHIISFVGVCTAEQIRNTPDKFVSLCRKLRDQAVTLNHPKKAIAPLLLAIQKLEPSPLYITPLHVFLFHVCLLTKCYNAAVPVLSEEVSEVDPSRTALTATDFLLYCYYGARIHIGRKHYREALQLLLQALTAPTMVVNAITVAAYKKYVLVHLIHSGSQPQLPKYTASAVNRAAKNECWAYQEVAQAYSKSNADLNAAVTKHTAAIETDGNMGLLSLALEARTKRAIQRLTQTYITLSLQHIAQQVGLPSPADAELHILRMIDSGDIYAEIDDARGMVRFQEDPEEYNSPELMARLDAQIQQSMRLAEQLQDTNHVVSCDKALLSKLGDRDRAQRGLDDPGEGGVEGIFNL